MKKIGKWSSFNLKGTRKAMKSITLGLMFLGLFSTATFAASGMKGKRVNLKLNNVRLSEVFSQVESQSDFVFVYNESQIDPAQLVSVDAKNESVEEVLKTVLGDVSFKVYENQIIIKKEYNTEALSTKTETASTLLAQQNTVKVSGTIVDNSGYGIPGVNVSVKGSTTGTITNFDGKYELEVSGDAILVYSFIGFETQEIALAGRTSVDVTMQEEVMSMDEVVVTALGIKREKKALGYAAAEVGSEVFENAKNANVMSALSGQVAGVQINSTSAGPGSSSSVLIRGAAVLNGSNEPLYVVDGIPISNTQLSNADSGDHGGVDSGNGMSGIAADDIENISVLKGPAATALYGSRAINGVVLITTKTGKGDQGTVVEFNSNMTFEHARNYADWQDVYGQGLDGIAPQNGDDARSQTSMWGGKYADVASYMDYQGREKSYQYYDNENNFYDLGRTWSNSVAINHNTEKSTVRLSYSNMVNEGMVPNTSYDRNSFTVNGGTNAFDGKLEVNAKLTYTKEESDNMTMGSSPFNPTSQLLGVPNNIPLADLQDYKDPKSGRPVGTGISGTSNLYWTLNEITKTYKKDRLMSLFTAKFSFTDHLSAQVRGGSDMTFFKIESLYPVNTPLYENGKADIRKADEVESNYDFLVTYDRNVTELFGLTVNAGASRMDTEFESLELHTSNFTNPQLQRPTFGADNTPIVGYSKKRINSVYGTAQFRYGSFAYLDVTARNDWSSTLPEDNNSYFYPSVSGSFILSEVLDLPIWMTFAKVRGSWAQVGSDTNPYKLALQYGLDKDPHPGWGGNDVSNGSISGNTIPNAILKPSLMTSHEFGADVKFLNNRLGMDVTYYYSLAEDQIMDVRVSGGSGFTHATVNSGSLENKGWEVSLYATPIRTNSVTWNTRLNWSKNNNEVVSLADGVEQLTLFSGGSVGVIAGVGMEYGTIIGNTFVRDEETGNITLDGNGLPIIDKELKPVGEAYHDMMMGWINSVSYKNFTLNVKLDSKFGGDMYSSTEASSYNSGKNKTTLERSEYTAGQEWFPKELEGLATTAKPSDYYGRISGVDDLFMYDASYILLQEVSLSYRFPAKLFSNNKYVRNASIGLFAKDLGYLYKATENIDPRSAYSISNGASGVELGNMALPTSFGFNVNIKF